MPWLLISVALLLAAVVLLGVLHNDLDRRLRALDTTARRAHLRADTHDRQIAAIGRDIGWVDDRAHTKVVTQPIPMPPKSEPPRS